MKALTNILNYILLLLMILIASCTEDAAEVDNLVRGEEYVTVRMQVPGMKNATTRADEAEDNLTSVWALVFRDGKLVSKTEVTTESTLIPSTSTTGTFKLSRPKVDDVIHFLGNVPNGVTLPDVGDDESALCNLETGDRENLSYWGKATYTGTDIDVNLYRHLAKIEIAPDPNECTFPEGQLFIAGLVNANTKGKLVPYDDENEAFNFDLSDENYGGNYDYCTVPTEPNPLEETPLLDNNGAGFKNWLYVFEHENPETADGLYVICKIGKYYYKVALIDEQGQPYDIIRNHRYVIYVKDLDEVKYEIPDDITEEDDIENYKYQQALASDPINLEVKEMKDVTLTITPSATPLQYGETSTEQVTVTVGGLQDVVKTLTFTAPGYTLLSDYAESAGEGVFTITDTSLTEIDFTLTLADPSQAGTIRVTGKGEYVNSCTEVSTSIQWNERQEVNGETVMWQGNVKMHVPENGDTKHAAKIGIPYSFFFDEDGNAKIPVGSTVRVESSGGGWLQAYKSGWTSLEWTLGENTTITLTQDLLDKIKTPVDAWGLPSAFVLQGGNGRVLTKVTLIPAKESITATADKTQLYYDSDDAQTVTVNVTVPDGVSAITIGGAEKFTIAKTAGNGTLNGTTYTLGNERTATFTFTLNQKNVTEGQVITFSGDNVNAASVPISMVQTPTEAVSEISATSGTIDMGSGQTSTTITLTKPSSVNGVNVNITDANGTNVNTKFSITMNGYTLSCNNGQFETINHGDENIPLVFAVIDENISAGVYTVTFTDAYNNQTTSGSTTITIVNTPSLQFKYDNSKTLYLDSNPQLPVTITVPEGSTLTQLNIKAADFTVTASSGTLSGSEGNYTYTGGSTTFTFVPTTTSATTIEFTGSGTNLMEIDKTIGVTVIEKKPEVTEIVLLGENDDVVVDWNPIQLDYEDLKDYKGQTMYAIVQIGNDESRQIRFENNNYGGIKIFESSDLPAGTETTLEVTIPENLSNYMQIRGYDVTIKKLYIPLTTQEETKI